MLPIHEIAPDIRSAIEENQRILLSAPTGSGKSTEVPGMLADNPKIAGRIIVIQPRRIAARMLASYVSTKRSTDLGDEVGYAIRFDSCYNSRTKILFLTDGVFQRTILDNPNLEGISAVIFDEFHERRLAVDIALGRCLELQENSRKDLRIVVMSATLDSGPLGDFMAPCKSIEASGRTYQVEILYRPHKIAAHSRSPSAMREAPIWERIPALVKEALTLPDPGNILIFLPGTFEIRRTIEALRGKRCTVHHEILPLYSALSPAEQNRALSSSATPKIIVSTNVAETSLTIPNVRTVIDSGMARSSAFDPRRCINTLSLQKISRAEADQRAGRAGRTAPGRCLRMWSNNEHARRPSFAIPEVARIDLSEAILHLSAAGYENPDKFRWVDPPPSASLRSAQNLLRSLGAVDPSGELTPLGKRMIALPLEPRFARLILAGIDLGCFPETAFIAATIQSGGIFPPGKAGSNRADFVLDHDFTDFASEYRAYSGAVEMRFEPRRLSAQNIPARNVRETSQIFTRLLKFGNSAEEPDFSKNHEATAKAILTAFSDHLAVRLNQGNLACRLSNNRRAKLEAISAARDAKFLVACELTEIEARETITHLRLATQIDLDHIRSLFPEELVQTKGVDYDEARRRVVCQEQILFRNLLLESRESDEDVPLDAAAEQLASRVINGELVLKKWDSQVEQFTHRLSCLSSWMPELELPSWDTEDYKAAIAQICHGSISYKQIKDIAVWPVLNEWLSTSQRHLLDLHCPERIRLDSGHTAKIIYSREADPFFSAKIAHLLETRKTPTIAHGRIPLLVHVLAPNQRPWQITKDLPNFWATGYPQMKKDLQGRYPRHPWP